MNNEDYEIADNLYEGYIENVLLADAKPFDERYISYREYCDKIVDGENDKDNPYSRDNAPGITKETFELALFSKMTTAIDKIASCGGDLTKILGPSNNEVEEIDGEITKVHDRYLKLEEKISMQEKTVQEARIKENEWRSSHPLRAIGHDSFDIESKYLTQLEEAREYTGYELEDKYRKLEELQLERDARLKSISDKVNQYKGFISSCCSAVKGIGDEVEKNVDQEYKKDLENVEHRKIEVTYVGKGPEVEKDNGFGM